MKVEFRLSIGYPAAERAHVVDLEEDYDITDVEWAEMSDEEKDKLAEEWAANYIEISLKEVS